MSTKQKLDETRLAEMIVSVLPEGVVARSCSEDRESIRYAVRGAMKLRTIVFRRDSLRRLVDDPHRNVKVEYLQRELAEAASRASEFRYPRPSLLPRLRAAVSFAWPMASTM